MPDKAAGRCTSRQQNAQITETRVVLYRWHPWHGQSVFVFGAMVKREQAFLRCALEADIERPLEVPQWMFDSVACCRTQLVSAPRVSIDVLRELQSLVGMVSRAAGRCVVEAQHYSQPDPGGACATRQRTALDRPADTVPSPVEDTALDEFSGGGTGANAEASRTASQTSSSCAAPKAGGVR